MPMDLMKLFQLLAAFAVLSCDGVNINYDYTDLQLADFIAMTVPHYDITTYPLYYSTLDND